MDTIIYVARQHGHGAQVHQISLPFISMREAGGRMVGRGEDGGEGDGGKKG